MEESSIRAEISRYQTLKDNLVENTKDKTSNEYREEYDGYVKKIADLKNTIERTVKKN